MSEQKKMDAERAAFEAWWVSRPHRNQPEKFANGDYCAPSVHSAWGAWQARASLPVGVPDESMVEMAAAAYDRAAHAGATHEQAWHEALSVALSAPAAPTVKESLSVAPTVKAEQVPVTHDLRAKLISGLDEIGALSRNLRHGGCDSSDLPGLEEGLAHAIDMAHELISLLEAPSLPAAGSAVEEVTPAMIQAACAAFRMDVSPMQAMQAALRAALSAQQSAPERVSVPVELLQDLHDLASDAVEHHRAAFAGYKLKRQANMDATVDKARALLASHAEGGKA